MCSIKFYSGVEFELNLLHLTSPEQPNEEHCLQGRVCGLRSLSCLSLETFDNLFEGDA